jgi:hypothetical protein
MSASLEEVPLLERPLDHRPVLGPGRQSAHAIHIGVVEETNDAHREAAGWRPSAPLD